MPSLSDQMSDFAPNKRIWVLDRGHGVDTPGKRSPDGSLREWEFNHDVRKRLAAYLDINQIPYIFTVTDEKDMSLRERTNIENKLAEMGYQTCFLSIHANAFGSGEWNDARGIETYSYPKARESKSMSKIFLNYLIKETGLLDRGAKEADFHVLRETKGNAVLTENGFMTNREEAELLKSDEFREKVARAHARAICKIEGIGFTDKKQDEGKPMMDWKTEAIQWLLDQKIITDPKWLEKKDEDVPMWAVAIMLRRVMEGMKNEQ
ncbi:N-acetylmuramoyl-L-alanine amidase [Microaerobacter geothermalis]|uniref:N-acetylmuramoyl-L-alanine amidase n=1 Tax=Microaerobacter geothermalis TaxID=674972 RepID=UPI001F261E45|nr:N-acetylmuramoyl-L-alanine amidase [Microaerobacter geothermalis]MCF6095050.1 N-acetylmuramoyl-L-alanine amidase [Microaerobacter geothermalis]